MQGSFFALKCEFIMPHVIIDNLLIICLLLCKTKLIKMNLGLYHKALKYEHFTYFE